MGCEAAAYWLRHQSLLRCNTPPPDLNFPKPHVPSSVCSFTELNKPFPENDLRFQSNSIEMPLTGVADDGVGGDVGLSDGKSPETLVVRCLIVPAVICPFSGFAAPTGHS